MPIRGAALEGLQVACKNRRFSDAELWRRSFLTDEGLLRAFGAHSLQTRYRSELVESRP